MIQLRLGVVVNSDGEREVLVGGGGRQCDSAELLHVQLHAREERDKWTYGGRSSSWASNLNDFTPAPVLCDLRVNDARPDAGTIARQVGDLQPRLLQPVERGATERHGERCRWGSPCVAFEGGGDRVHCECAGAGMNCWHPGRAMQGTGGGKGGGE